MGLWPGKGNQECKHSGMILVGCTGIGIICYRNEWKTHPSLSDAFADAVEFDMVLEGVRVGEETRGVAEELRDNKGVTEPKGKGDSGAGTVTESSESSTSSEGKTREEARRDAAMGGVLIRGRCLSKVASLGGETRGRRKRGVAASRFQVPTRNWKK